MAVITMTGRFVNTVEEDGSLLVLMLFDDGPEILLSFPAETQGKMAKMADDSLVWSEGL